MVYVYEVRDVTDCERYYSIGVYSSLELAIAACRSDGRVSNYSDCEEEVLEVYQIVLDSSDAYPRKVATVTRIEDYDDETDECKWVEEVKLS